MNNEFSINELDKKILNLLLKNSRQSYRRLAKKLGISVATVLKHVKKLEKMGIIRKYTCSLDYEKLGYDILVIIEIRIAKGKLIEVEKKIATHRNVYAVYDHTGAFDATLIARFKNRRALDNFVKLIQSYDFVERTETKLVLNTIKEEGNLIY